MASSPRDFSNAANDTDFAARVAQSAHRRKRHRGHRFAIVAFLTIAIVAAIAFVLPSVLAPMVQRKLESMVANQLKARLVIGSLSYQFPYGVNVRDVRFIAEDDASPNGATLLSIKSLDLSLAALPLDDGPIVIKSFTMTDPVLNVIRRENGSVVGSHLARRPKDSPRPEERVKLSDLLQLRHFELKGATVIYEDRSRHGAKPMEWSNVGANLDLNPQSASRYAFHFKVDSAPTARIEFKGAADIDSMIVDLERVAISAEVRRDAPSSALPIQLQQVLDELGVDGSVRIDITGRLPLKEPKSGHFAADVILDRVHVDPPNRPWALDELSAKLRIERGAAIGQPDRIDLTLSDLTAYGIGARLDLKRAAGAVDLAAKTWKAEGVSGTVTASEGSPVPGQRSVLRYVQRGRVVFDGGASGSYAPNSKHVQHSAMIIKADGLSVQPKNFPLPLEAITGQIQFTDDRAMLQNITATYGNDRLALNQALIPLGDLRTRIDLQNILGNVEFGSPTSRYPAPLAAAIEQLNPTGRLDIQGTAALYRKGKQLDPDFLLQLLPQNMNLTLLNNTIPLTNFHGEISVAPRMITTKFVEADTLDGKIGLRGDLVPRAPVTYQGELRVENADLSLLSKFLNRLKPDGSPRVTGRARAKMRFSGQIPPAGEGDALQSLTATGRVLVTEGDFWSAPVLDGVVREIKFARNMLTASEAAARFGIKDGKFAVNPAAISSAALGIQGTGTVGLRDSSIDLNIVVAPLGDWRLKIRHTGIPLISNVVGDIAGGLQRIVNSTTSNLLYQFRVTGSLTEPKVSAVPAPLLTDSAARVFAIMLGGTKAERLAEEVAPPEPEEAKVDEPDATKPDATKTDPTKPGESKPEGTDNP